MKNDYPCYVWKPVKIGIATNLRSRLYGIKSSNWMPIQLASAFRLPSRFLAQQVEAITHQVLAIHNFQGEWFAVHPVEASLVVQRVIFEAARYVRFDPSICPENAS